MRNALCRCYTRPHMTKGNYVDGFVLVVPKKNKKVYKKMAAEAATIWKKFGALDYKECLGDDMKPNMQGMPVLTFPKMTKSRPSEAVWFSFIVFKDKRHRDTVNKKVMSYFNKKYANQKDQKMPFDLKRMAYGG